MIAALAVNSRQLPLLQSALPPTMHPALTTSVARTVLQLESVYICFEDGDMNSG